MEMNSPVGANVLDAENVVGKPLDRIDGRNGQYRVLQLWAQSYGGALLCLTPCLRPSRIIGTGQSLRLMSSYISHAEHPITRAVSGTLFV